jgi:hypothetical protein
MAGAGAGVGIIPESAAKRCRPIDADRDHPVAGRMGDPPPVLVRTR